MDQLIEPTRGVRTFNRISVVLAVMFALLNSTPTEIHRFGYYFRVICVDTCLEAVYLLRYISFVDWLIDWATRNCSQCERPINSGACLLNLLHKIGQVSPIFGTPCLLTQFNFKNEARQLETDARMRHLKWGLEAWQGADFDIDSRRPSLQIA